MHVPADQLLRLTAGRLQAFRDKVSSTTSAVTARAVTGAANTSQQGSVNARACVLMHAFVIDSRNGVGKGQECRKVRRMQHVFRKSACAAARQTHRRQGSRTA